MIQISYHIQNLEITVIGAVYRTWRTLSPFPQLREMNSFGLVGLCWLCYFGICIAVDVVILRKDRGR
jgi:hypothetical protein